MHFKPEYLTARSPDGQYLHRMSRQDLGAFHERCGVYEVKHITSHKDPPARMVLLCEAANYYAWRYALNDYGLRNLYTALTGDALPAHWPAHALLLMCDVAEMDNAELLRLARDTLDNIYHSGVILV
jgi:hypothetical protein